jgi:membrane protein required for colicin V production
MFDLIVLLVLGISAIVGFVRGATRELVAVVAFVLAVFIAVFALRFTAPMALEIVPAVWLAKGIALLVGFIAAYILLRVLGSAMTRRIHDVPALGTFDRTIGLGFGLVRALVILGLFNLFFHAITPADRTPAWVTGAKTYPLTAGCARMLVALAPKGFAMADKVAPAISKAVKEGVETPPQTDDDKATDRGYSPAARKSLDDLVERSR